MKSILLNLLNMVSKPFAGKGIDKKFPQLITLYQKLYKTFQKPTLVTVELPNNAKLQVMSDDPHLGAFLIYYKAYEPLETDHYIKSLTSQSIIFDIGANVGYYSTIGAKTAKKVYSFEPDKANYQQLQSNISLNNLTNVQAENLAISNTEGELPFHSDPIHRGKSGVSFNNNNADYVVKATTVDKYCETNQISSIDIIKLDVEGSEIPVLMGAAATIKNSPNLKLYVEYNPGSLKDVHKTPKDFFETLSQVGLKPVKIIDETRKQILEFTEQNLSQVLNHATFTNLYCERA